MTRLLLELGGKGASIIFDDADVGRAIMGTGSTWAFHSGQICTAPTRVLAQRGVYEQVVAGLAQQVAVMYAGRVVEYGTVDNVLDRQGHPYTEGLLGSLPAAAIPGQPLRQIPGSTPSLGRLPPGCAFAPRCSYTSESCRQSAPAITTLPNGSLVRCHHPLTHA